METFIKELTGRRQVQNNLTKGKGFPIWAKIAIPAAAVVLIATAVLVIPMFLGKSSADLPLDGQTVVPSVLHYNLEKAGEELKKYGLLPEIAGRKIDDSVGENEVLSQNVESGSIVGMNTVVGLTVSAHSNEISMPNLLGMNIGSCGELLDDLGLHYSISREKSASVSENCIISQSITPYTKITASQEIALTVSLGAPEEDYADYQPRDVGDFTDKSYNDAVTQANADRTPVEVEERVFDDCKPEGTVVGQSPAAGEKQNPGEPVRVIVTTAQLKSTVPDVRYLDKTQAQALLEHYGFETEFSSEQNDDIAEGLVVSQNLPAGEEAESGTVLSVRVRAALSCQTLSAKHFRLP